MSFFSPAPPPLPSDTSLNNPKYFLQHYRPEAKLHWLRGVAVQSRDPRMHLYVFFELQGTLHARLCTIFVSCTIIVMLLLMVYATHVDDGSDAAHAIENIMIACNGIFTAELLLRLVALTSPLSGLRSVKTMLLQAMSITIDSIAVLSFWLQLAVPDTPRWLDIFGALRVFRLINVLANTSEGGLIISTVATSVHGLSMSFSLLVVFAFFFGAVLYYVERLSLGSASGLNDFSEMSMGIWFILVTFTTVGYGDVSPNSWSGRAVTVVAIFFAVVFMAMPITIVGSNFQHAWEKRRENSIVLRIQRSMINKQMRAEEIATLLMAKDIDHSGEISFLEFGVLLREIGVDLSTKEQRSLFNVFDNDGSGTIEIQEFCQHVFPDIDLEAMSKRDLKKNASKAVLGKDDDRESERNDGSFACRHHKDAATADALATVSAQIRSEASEAPSRARREKSRGSRASRASRADDGHPPVWALELQQQMQEMMVLLQGVSSRVAALEKPEKKREATTAREADGAEKPASSIFGHGLGLLSS